MPDRPADSPDVNPAVVSRDPLLAEIADLLAYLDLHLGRHPWAQLTTRQKELLADLIDSEHVLHPGGAEERPWFVARWWRDDWVQPDFEDTDHFEEDPFIYGARRAVPAPSFEPPAEGALALARGTTMGEANSPFLLEDRVAVYEWARRAVRPFRNTAGAIVAGLVVYPSLSDARAYLAAYRAAREERFSAHEHHAD